MFEPTEEQKEMIDKTGVGIMTENLFFKILFFGHRSKDIRSAQIEFFSIPNAMSASFIASNIIYLLFSGQVFLNVSALSGALISIVTLLIYMKKFGFDKNLYLKKVSTLRILGENAVFIMFAFIPYTLSYLMIPDEFKNPNIYFVYVVLNPFIYVWLFTFIMSQFMMNCLRLCKSAY